MKEIIFSDLSYKIIGASFKVFNELRWGLSEKDYQKALEEDKILIEIKTVFKLGYVHAKQILNYLRVSNIKLGILIYFTKEGVKYRRILNSQA